MPKNNDRTANPCNKCGELPNDEQFQHWHVIECGGCGQKSASVNFFVAHREWNTQNPISSLDELVTRNIMTDVAANFNEMFIGA